MAKVGIDYMSSSVTQAKLSDFVDRYFPGRVGSFVIPRKGETVMSPPNGYVAIYMKSFSMCNVRYPFSNFFLSVLKHYGRHVSLMHPQGHSKIMAFEIMCRALGGEPSVEMFRRFATICDAGEWVTIANRAKVGCFLKGGVDVRNWKKEYVFMSVDLFPNDCEVLVSPENLKVEGTTLDPLPDGEGNGELFDMISRNHFIVWTFPDSVLYKARVISELPVGGERLDGKTVFCV